MHADVNSTEVSQSLESFAPAELTELYVRSGYDLEDVFFNIKLMLDDSAMIVALWSRIEEKHPLGAALLQCLEGGASADLHSLEHLLGVSNLRSHRPSKYGQEDLHALGVAEAWTHYSRLRHEAEERKVPVCKLVPDSFADDAGQWGELLELYEHVARKPIAMLLPILEGKTEGIRETVRQRLREEFRKWKAQKRAGVETSMGGIDDNVMDNGVERRYTKRLYVQELLHSAHNRWGERALRFLAGVAEGHSILEAAARAGISRQTGTKYLRELRHTAVQGQLAIAVAE